MVTMMCSGWSSRRVLAFRPIELPIFQGLHRWVPLMRVDKWSSGKGCTSRPWAIALAPPHASAVQPLLYVSSRGSNALSSLLRVCPLSLFPAWVGSLCTTCADPASAVLPNAQLPNVAPNVGTP
jgi:hypothetical protein